MDGMEPSMRKAKSDTPHGDRTFGIIGERPGLGEAENENLSEEGEACWRCGARRRTRTGTDFTPRDFKSLAATITPVSHLIKFGLRLETDSIRWMVPRVRLELTTP